MAVAHIAEYTELGVDRAGNLTFPLEPCKRIQNVTYSGTAGQSLAFHTSTRIVRIVSSGACYYAVGGNPTAVTAVATLLPANTVEYIGVKGGEKISFVS